ncbi:patatin-like phospholipase family protein [uncultured Negativibacillus sp.]|uniref:patatin-like phospholipase family protein n=1 Tax=uncultured Negativibacillus sp. TaxID=1980696 RepID=UPI0025CF4FE0|nr:patatin-like phospholipase family protein [uncultured Negativibacillus sp.]
MSKTAVVLAGGGSRGAYQIGVWKALRELGIEYQLVTGTSVGALNGVLMVQGDFEKALQIWENLSSQDVVGDMLEGKGELDDRQLTRVFAHEALAKGGADISALEKFVNSMLDEPLFWKSPVDFALVTVEYPSMKPLELEKKDIPQGMLGEYLLASAACFPAFQAKEIDGKKYIDGGYHDNMPINLALKMGADQIIAIDLESVGVSRRIKKGDQKIVLIRSLWPLGSFLKFEGQLARRNIQLGYLDACKAFNKVDGQMYAFVKDSAFFYTAALHEAMEELAQQAEQREPKIVSAVQNVVLHRMLREFRKRSRYMSTPHSFTLSRQMMMAAEYLGEILGVDPQKEYLFGDFLQLLLQKSEQCREKTVDTEAFHPEHFTDLQRMAEELQKLDRSFLVLLIRQRIEHFLQGGGSLAELVVVSAFWREFVAAVFLYLLERISFEDIIE